MLPPPTGFTPLMRGGGGNEWVMDETECVGKHYVVIGIVVKNKCLLNITTLVSAPEVIANKFNNRLFEH